jgi:hypothetical protein
MITILEDLRPHSAWTKEAPQRFVSKQQHFVLKKQLFVLLTTSDIQM